MLGEVNFLLKRPSFEGHQRAPSSRGSVMGMALWQYCVRQYQWQSRGEDVAELLLCFVRCAGSPACVMFAADARREAWSCRRQRREFGIEGPSAIVEAGDVQCSTEEVVDFAGRSVVKDRQDRGGRGGQAWVASGVGWIVVSKGRQRLAWNERDRVPQILREGAGLAGGCLPVHGTAAASCSTEFFAPRLRHDSRLAFEQALLRLLLLLDSRRGIDFGRTLAWRDALLVGAVQVSMVLSTSARCTGPVSIAFAFRFAARVASWQRDGGETVRSSL